MKTVSAGSTALLFVTSEKFRGGAGSKGRNRKALRQFRPMAKSNQLCVVDMIDAEPGRPLFRPRQLQLPVGRQRPVRDRFGTIRWNKPAKSDKRRPPRTEENPFQVGSATQTAPTTKDDIAIFSVAGDAGKPGVVRQVAPDGRITAR